MEKLLIGRTLADRYLVEDILGRGGMSVVYRSTDTRLNRPVAVKIVAFPPDIDEGDRQMLRDRLRREATAAASLSSHPNVVQVYDYGTDAALDLDFIAMELLIGEDLKEVLARGGLEYVEAVEILRGAMSGVAAGHRAGIVHRDMKPANIFLTPESGRTIVKVLDFGIAKALDPSSGDDLTRHDHTPHSPAYASPEQMAMTGQTFASDVYQLGLVAYELLAGERPFTADDRQMIAAGSAVPLPEGSRWASVPSAVRHVVRTALDPDPAARFLDAMQLGRAFEAATEDDATVAFSDVVRAESLLVDQSDDPGEPGVMHEGASEWTAATGEVGRASELAMGADGPDSPMGSDGLAPYRRATDRPRRATPFPLLLAGLAVTLMMAWLLLRGPAGGSAGSGDGLEGGAPAISNVEVQDGEMRPLMLEAYENLGGGETPP